MPDQEKILSHFDKSAIVGLQVVIACFVALIVVISLVFAIATTAFVVCWLVARKALVFILTRPQTHATFAMLGGCRA